MVSTFQRQCQQTPGERLVDHSQTTETFKFTCRINHVLVFEKIAATYYGPTTTRTSRRKEVIAYYKWWQPVLPSLSDGSGPTCPWPFHGFPRSNSVHDVVPLAAGLSSIHCFQSSMEMKCSMTVLSFYEQSCLWCQAYWMDAWQHLELYQIRWKEI